MVLRKMTKEEVIIYNQYIKYLKKARDLTFYACEIEQLNDLISSAYKQLEDKTIFEV